MFFAIAVLLVQPQIAPRPSIFPNEKIALIQATISPTSSDDHDSRSFLAPAPAGGITTAESTVEPVTESTGRAALPDAPVPEPAVEAPMPLLAKPIKPMTVSVDELRAENRRNLLLWRGLVITSASAATFDAWSTRHTLTTVPGSRELDPLMKPFAGNASIYAAIQVGPLLMDYVGKKMMYSSHGWVRRIWWVPQSAGVVSSLFCGVHNLGVQ